MEEVVCDGEVGEDPDDAESSDNDDDPVEGDAAWEGADGEEDDAESSDKDDPADGDAA